MGHLIRRRPRGFTLIELLVVLVVIGIAMTMITVGGFQDAQRGLRFEAERMAQLLLLAREEAQVRGRPIRLVADASGYRFVMLVERQWQPLTDDPELRARAWDAPTRLDLQRSDGRAVVEFGRDSVDPPFTLRLSRGDAGVTIAANGLGFFDVRQP